MAITYALPDGTYTTVKPSSSGSTSSQNLSISSPANLEGIASMKDGSTRFRDKVTGATVDLQKIASGTSSDTYFNAGTKTTINIPKTSAASGIAEPNISLATGGVGVGVGGSIVSRTVGQGIPLGAGAAQTSSQIPKTVFSPEIVKRSFDDVQTQVISFRGGKEPKILIPAGGKKVVNRAEQTVTITKPITKELYVLKGASGRAVILPSGETSKAKQVRAELYNLAVKSGGDISPSLVSVIAAKSGLPFAGSTSLFPETVVFSEKARLQARANEGKEDFEVLRAAQAGVINLPNKNPLYNNSSSEFASTTVSYGSTSTQVTQEVAGVPRTSFGGVVILSPEEVKGKEFYEGASDVQKAAIVVNILGTSKEGFNLAGSALVNSPESKKKLYSEIYKKMIERRNQEELGQSRFEGAVKTSFGAFADSETIAGTAVQGAALGYGFGAIGQLAPIASRIPVAGKTIAEATNLFNKNPKFTEAAVKGVGTGFIGYSGYEPYAKSKEAGESESTALSRGTSGALKAAVFIGGAKVGSDVYKRFPSPLKGADIEVPTKITLIDKPKIVKVPVITTERAYTGLTLELPRELPAGLSNKVIPLVGKGESGGYIFGRFPKAGEVPSLSLTKNLDKVALNLETPAQAQFFTSPETLKALNPLYTTEAELGKAGLLPVVQYGAGVVVTPTGKLPTKTLSAGENVKIILDELKNSGKSFVLKGSFPAKAKLQKKFTEFEARDIDANIEATPAEAIAIRQKILTRLKNEAKGDYKFSAATDGYGITSVNPQGVQGHALDLKLKGETFVEPSPYTVLSSTGDTSRLGISVTNQPTELVEGFKTQSLAEQGTRKAGTSLTMLFDKGKYTFQPETKGRVAKDVADVLPIYSRLLEVRGSSPALYGRLQTFTKSYLKTGQLTEADLAARGLGIEPKTGKIISRPELLEGKEVKLELARFEGKKLVLPSSKIIVVQTNKVIPLKSGVASTGKTINLNAVSKNISNSAGKLTPSASYPSSSKSPSPKSPFPSPKSPSPKSPSLPSPSPSSVSGSNSGYRYSSQSKSNYGYGSGSNYASKSGIITEIYRYVGSKSGAFPQGNEFSPNRKITSLNKGKVVKQKLNLFPSLVSITRQQVRTGSLFYKAPSLKAIQKSSIYRRSGGEVVPVGEQLKEKAFGFAKGLFGKRKGQAAIFNIAGLFILLVFFAFSLDSQLVVADLFANNQITGLWGSSLSTVIIAFFSFFMLAGMFLTMISNRSVT